MDHELTDTERDMLALERQWFRYAGIKEQRVREAFKISMTTYYQRLNGLLDNPAALAADPLTVNRLRRLREARQRASSLRHAG